MSIKAVIFDLDGTITEPVLDFDVIRLEIGLGKNSGPILESMAEMSAEQREKAEQILHRYEQKAVSESALNPGVEQTLWKLKKAGIYLAILTRNTSENALAVVEKHGLEFDIVIGRDHGPVKPDAFGILDICGKLNVAAAESMMVGDYLFDMQCARAAGAVAVLLKNRDGNEKFSEYADFTIKKFEHILEIVEDSNNGNKI